MFNVTNLELTLYMNFGGFEGGLVDLSCFVLQREKHQHIKCTLLFFYSQIKGNHSEEGLKVLHLVEAFFIQNWFFPHISHVYISWAQIRTRCVLCVCLCVCFCVKFQCACGTVVFM